MRPIGRMHELWFGEGAIDPRADNARRLAGIPAEGCEERDFSFPELTGVKIKGGVPASNTYRLSTTEKDKIALQTGAPPPDDYANYKRWKRENKMRDEERGERSFESKAAIKEWTRGGCVGPNPVGPSSIKNLRRRQESYQELKARYRREGVI